MERVIIAKLDGIIILAIRWKVFTNGKLVIEQFTFLCYSCFCRNENRNKIVFKRSSYSRIAWNKTSIYIVLSKISKSHFCKEKTVRHPHLVFVHFLITQAKCITIICRHFHFYSHFVMVTKIRKSSGWYFLCLDIHLLLNVFFLSTCRIFWVYFWKTWCK